LSRRPLWYGLRGSRAPGLAPRIAAVGAVAALVLAGCGDGSDSGSNSGGESGSFETTTETSDGGSATEKSPSEPSKAGDQKAGDLERAGAAALKKVPDSTVTELDAKRNGLWKVEVVTTNGTEREMRIDPANGKIVRGPDTDDDDADDRAEHRRKVEGAKLDFRAAAKKVRSVVNGARITELELDTHRGTVVWEADLVVGDGKKYDVKIDAKSGKVVQKKVDRDGHDDDDDDDDDDD